jgi:hypothetical protein
MLNTAQNVTAMSRNPFVMEHPEELTSDQIVALFVEQYTKIETIKQRKHTFIWGSRGSGKSMMLRYLEPACQRSLPAQRDEGPRKLPFIGVYCRIRSGYFDKNEFRVVDKQVSRVIGEHLLNMYVAELVLECLNDEFSEHLTNEQHLGQFVTEVLRLFERVSISPSLEEANLVASRDVQPMEWLRAVLLSEIARVANFLREFPNFEHAHTQNRIKYKGTTTGYHDFLLPFMKALHRLLGPAAAPIYILMDDAHKLSREQQLVVNTWVANRDQAYLCLKIAAELEAYKTFNTIDIALNDIAANADMSTTYGGLIEAPHDYTEVYVDEIYTNLRSDYLKKVRLICNRRLELWDVKTRDIENFLPEDPDEKALFERLRQIVAQEWEASGSQGDKRAYVHRHTTARLFQNLAKRNMRKSYAGFQNIVHLSSGVIRNFLEPCFLMFDSEISRREEQHASLGAVNFISPELQNELLYEYSEEFLLRNIDKIRPFVPVEKWSHLEALTILIASLGQLYYNKLHNQGTSEAGVFSFTVRGHLPHPVDEILRLGLQYRYFQLRSYGTKGGGGREIWYILNRRLCPSFKLDPTSLGGRILLTPALLKLACEDTEKFIKSVERAETKDGGGQQLSYFSDEDLEGQNG